MAGDPSLDAELFHELLLELVRAGVLTQAMIGAVERRFEAEAHTLAGNSRAERYQQLAHMARLLPAEAAAPSPSEFVADQRRRRFRIVPDGGNEPA